MSMGSRANPHTIRTIPFDDFDIKNSKWYDENTQEEQEKFKLHLIVGEDIPENSPEEFSMIVLYVRDKEDNLNLYADISLPYLINHSEFLNIDGDPRYFFQEKYESETKISRYTCEVKPFGSMKGIYRILNGQRIKIQSIEPLCEVEKDIKVHKLVKVNK